MPMGMKYQAVARNVAGEILPNRTISLQIDLKSDPAKGSVIYYTEQHTVTTNQLGLFDLVVGSGKCVKGSFKDVPWSTQDIWMAVSLKDKGSDFSAITESRLLAVPYAFYAVTASSLVNNKSVNNQNTTAPINNNIISSGETKDLNINPGINGVSSNVWSLQGNNNTNPSTDKLGTSDLADIVIVTNDIERMRITSGGDVQMKNSLEVGNNLTVKNNVSLNTTGGATTNNGRFTVTDGTQSTSTTNGALVVTGGAGIDKNLNVGGDLNVLNGTSTLKNLTVDGVTGKSININDNSTGYLATFVNTNNDNGANAGDGIKIQLGKERPLDLNSFQLPTYSTFLPGITNALSNSIFTNGAFNTNFNTEDFFNNLKNGFISDFTNYGDMLVAGLCHLTNTIIDQVNDGITSINTTLSLPYNLSTPINTGLSLPINLATPLNSALGLPFNISTPINSGLGLPVNISSSINSGLHLPFSVSAPINNALGLPLNIADLVTIPALPGISIPSLPSLSIPSLPSLSIPAIPNSFAIPALPNIILPAIPTIPHVPNCPPLTNPFGFNLAFPTVSNNPLTKNNEFVGFFDKDGNKVGAIRGQSLQDKIEDLTSIPTLLDVATSLFISFDFDEATADAVGFFKVGAKTLDYFVQTWDAIGKIGVEYSSGAGDYAEWLQRLDPNETISTGDIVAVKGGKITKDLNGAEQVMAVSSHPIVLGNEPAKNKTANGNDVAFMGQIPVKIMGPVKAGDYIVAKGNVPGYGVAVDPQDMKVEDYKLAVGRSWDSNDMIGPKMVNTVVGVHNNGFLEILKNLQDKVNSDDTRLKTIEARLNISSATEKIKEKKAF